MDMQKNTDRSAVEMELDELMNISGGVPSLETQKRALMNEMRSAKASGKTFDEWLDSVPRRRKDPGSFCGQRCPGAQVEVYVNTHF